MHSSFGSEGQHKTLKNRILEVTLFANEIWKFHVSGFGSFNCGMLKNGRHSTPVSEVNAFF